MGSPKDYPFVRDVVSSLIHHDFRRFLVINGHGGDIPAINIACSDIQRDLLTTFIAARTYYTSYDPVIDKEFKDCGGGGHACGMDFMVSNLRAALVRSSPTFPSEQLGQNSSLIILRCRICDKFSRDNCLLFSFKGVNLYFPIKRLAPVFKMSKMSEYAHIDSCFGECSF